MSRTALRQKGKNRTRPLVGEKGCWPVPVRGLMRGRKFMKQFIENKRRHGGPAHKKSDSERVREKRGVEAGLVLQKRFFRAGGKEPTGRSRGGQADQHVKRIQSRGWGVAEKMSDKLGPSQEGGAGIGGGCVHRGESMGK